VRDQDVTPQRRLHFPCRHACSCRLTGTALGALRVPAGMWVASALQARSTIWNSLAPGLIVKPAFAWLDFEPQSFLVKPGLLIAKTLILLVPGGPGGKPGRRAAGSFRPDPRQLFARQPRHVPRPVRGARLLLGPRGCRSRGPVKTGSGQNLKYFMEPSKWLLVMMRAHQNTHICVRSCVSSRTAS